MSYKLTYFNSRGRAETTRLLFALGDIKYEDVRTGDDEWQALKPKTPFLQLPVLEVDGVMIGQSRAMERLVAKRIDLYGKDDLEQARTDMIVDCVEDMAKPLMIKMFSVPEDQRPEVMKKYASEELPSFLEKFEKLINSDGYFISNKIMYADVAFYSLLSNMLGFGAAFTEQVDKFSKIKALLEKVEAHPKIAKWIKERPQSNY